MKPNTQRTRRIILPALLIVALLGNPTAPTSLCLTEATSPLTLH